MPGSSQPDVFHCPRDELSAVSRLFTLPRGSLYLGEHAGRPVFFVEESSMTGWTGDPEDLEPGQAKVYAFEREPERWEYVTRFRWDRLQDDYLREELRSQYSGEWDFDQAYRDARRAIEALPCEDCGQVLWPALRAPEPESGEWWDDPRGWYVCASCGRRLARPGA